MKQIKIFGFFLVLLVSVMAFKPANDFVARIMASLDAYMSQYPPEKIYVLTDKSIYAVGENMWYKAWLVNGVNHQTNSPSRLMYVELLGPDLKVKLYQTLSIDGGIAVGDFYIPEELESGTYTLRAYTSWMRNFDPSFFFQRQIEILNNDHLLNTNLITALDKRIEVQFLPEGGEWVEGLRSVLGISAHDAYGKGLQVSGAIYDDLGTEVSRFTTSTSGLGRIMLQPERGRTYYARVDGASNEESGERIQLPKALGSGFVLNIDGRRENDIQLSIYNNLSDRKARDQDILILAHVRGIVYYAAKGRADRDEFSAILDRDRFPAGIIHFTLFTENGMPVAERLVYNPSTQQPKLLVNTDKESYGRRELVQMDIVLTDPSGKPLQGNVAVSVTNSAEIADEPLGLNIENYLYLVSDLGGMITDPGQYTQFSMSRLSAADDLMLTKGWRRFDWQTVMKGEEREYDFALEQGLRISGTVINKNSRKPAPSQYVLFAILGDIKEFYDTETDRSGRFQFQNLMFPDSTDVILQTIDSRERRYYDFMLEPQNNYDMRPLKLRIPPADPLELSKAYADYLRLARDRDRFDRAFGLQNDVRVLGEVTVTAERESLPPPRTTRLLTTPDRTIKADDIRNSARNPIEMLAGRTASFRVTGTGSSTEVTFNRGIAFGGVPPVPLFFLDGSEVDLQTILSVPSIVVESIDLLTDVGSLAIYGSRGSNGVIAVNTRSGGSFNTDPQGVISKPFAGYYVPRQFYAANYSEAKDIHRKPDYRATIWWQPNVNISREGIAKIQFWTSDNTGADFRVRVEGITSNGDAIIGTHMISIK